MEDKDKLNKIKEWAESSHYYISERADYSRGYKDGLTQAKLIILEILNLEEK